MKKIVQLTAVGMCLYALCDDGSVWRLDGREWRHVSSGVGT